ncbi:MAG: hypothetical protein VR64_04955 [Desulfatitalea sp. BRH_c12]|nr:MAG: hypothetical protein VR64_04955 [Desulfatitalea sp. BRH_c12]
MIEIPLDLSRHCIETEVRRLYNRALSGYFRAGQDKSRIEQTIDLTQHALQTFDFGRLRATHAPLAGQSNAKVSLVRDGQVDAIRIDGQEITPIEREKP